MKQARHGRLGKGNGFRQQRPTAYDDHLKAAPLI
jgi:hypothetical protein